MGYSCSVRLSFLRCACGLFAISLAACSSIDLKSAVALGNTGVQTATSYQQSVSAISPALDNYVVGQDMLAGLTGRPAPGGDFDASISQLQAALSARATMLGQLGQVYTSFIALASYDAQGQVQSSLTNLDGSINSFASTLGATATPLSPGVDALISNAGGLIDSQIQKNKVMQASEAISARLSQIIPLLATEQQRYKDLQKVVTQGLRDTAIAFWTHGMASPDQLFAAQVSPFGLSYKRGSFASACAGAADPSCKDDLKSAVAAAIEYRAKRLTDLQAETISSNQTALANLLTAHKQFEEGQPLDLAAITAQLALVRSIVDDINQANNK
jgi:hypothetical protein